LKYMLIQQMLLI